MSDVQHLIVDCVKDGHVLASFAAATTSGSAIDRSELEHEAKQKLADQHLAMAPFDGIIFGIRLTGR